MSRPAASAAVRWTAYAAVALVFAVACAFLSNWQFVRNADRSEQLTLVAANYDADPVPLQELIPRGGTFDPGDQWRPVELRGEYLNDEQLLARNRPHGGTAAFEVLVPFRTEDGTVIVVDRGWVPPGQDQPEPDVVPSAPSGPATVVVRLKAGEALPNSGRSAPEGQVPTINLALIGETIPSGADLVESAYGLLVSEEPAPTTAPRLLESPSEDPGPHLSYAIQWILFAIMGFIFIGYIIRTERKHSREDAEDAAAAEAARAGASAEPSEAPASAPVRRVRAPRKRDRDSVDEDELLDRVRH